MDCFHSFSIYVILITITNTVDEQSEIFQLLYRSCRNFSEYV